MYDAETWNAILANSARLLKDAKLLVAHERYASAFALSVLALEKIGKAILELRGNPKVPPPMLGARASAHTRKQVAVPSLLVAGSVVRDEELSEAIRSSPVVSDELIERVGRFIHESKTGRFHWQVGRGALDKTKQVALYSDRSFEDAGLKPEQFDGADLETLFAQCLLALEAVSDQHIMHVGKAIYEAGFAFRNSWSLQQGVAAH